ncbi:hypothetical protein EES42_39515 [Streptomyces sp. ADI95-17]|nr:hypothetical protein EES42_39515 [Streptomyces sp. ADI95-17]
MTWKSGVVDRSRSGSSSSAIRSNGVSWWSKASSTVVRLAARTSRKAGSAPQRPLSTRVLYAYPAICRSSGRVRPETAVPTDTSRLPV